MCLTIDNFATRQLARDFTKTPLVAMEDITVYKVFRRAGKKLVSPYMYYEYERGFIYYQTDKPFSFNTYKGFWPKKNWFVEVSKGLHSFKDKLSSESILVDGGEILTCIIPKGSLYFKNEREIVSNQLLIP